VLEATRAGDRVRFTCTCPAGEIGQVCKHRLSLLNGDITRLMSDTAEVERLRDLVRGSKVEKHFQELENLKSELERLKRLEAAAKKALAREMA